MQIKCHYFGIDLAMLPVFVVLVLEVGYLGGTIQYIGQRFSK